MSDSGDAQTIQVRCGCCRKAFEVPLGGSAYCAGCLSGAHADCIVKELKQKS